MYGFDHDPEELVLELESGQIALRADVEERNGQQVLEELAPLAKPAPCTFERDATEELARRQLEELAREAAARIEAGELVAGFPDQSTRDFLAPILEEPREELAPSAYVLELEDGTREELTEAGPVISGPVTIADHGKTLEAEVPAAARARAARVYRCAYCGEELKPEHWIYSRHTGARYCWPGEGCNVPTQHRASGPNVRLALEELERAGEEG